MRIRIGLCLAAALAAAGCSDDDGSDARDYGDVRPDLDTPGEAGADADAAPDAGPDGSEETGDAGDGETTADVVEETADDGEAETDGDWIVPAAAECTAAGDPCTTASRVPGIFATYRKDYYYTNDRYNEYTDPPLDGGRFHLAAISAVTGTVTELRLNGASADSLLRSPTLEWYHVWPRRVVAGEPVWIAFHSRDPAWDSATTGTVELVTGAGVAVTGSFPVQVAPVLLTYVTTSDDLRSFLIHAKNTDDVPHTVERLLVNGIDVEASGAACLPEHTLEPGETALWIVPQCAPIAVGGAWTVVAQFTDAADAVGVGRVIRPFFPIESWPNTGECPFPGVNDANFARHQEAGLDTTFIYAGGGSACGGYDTFRVVNVEAPARAEFQVLLADDFLSRPSPETLITDTSGTAGFLIGDESDGNIYDEDTGVPIPWEKAQQALQLWEMYPDIPVYNGAKTNKYVGAFAGMCDIQGIDFYVAACAPHITAWGVHPPLRGAYDYLRNARNNHMPLPTWTYAQGLHQGWNKDALIGGGTIHVQPDPQEILVQALSVAAAGGKGIMWFQVNLEEADYRPARWEAIARSNWMIRGVRPYLREGDVTGLAASDGEAIVEAIRARDALVVPVINLAVRTAPTDVSCGAALVTEALVPHWVLDPAAPSVTVTVPDDFAVADVFEITDREVRELDVGLAVDGRDVTFESVALSNDVPVRLFVLARDETVRAAVLSRLRP